MLQRLGLALSTARQAVEESKGGLSPSSPVKTRKGLALLALGPDLSTLPERLEKEAASIGARGLLITGNADARVFLRLGLGTEYLPDWAQVVLATGESRDAAGIYLLRRLQNMFDRWVITECLWSGDAAAELIEFRSRFRDLSADGIQFRRLD